MPKIAKEFLDERRAHIVAAARRVLARKGLSRTTLRDVFREAGSSAGAVYNYFQTKDDLVLAVTESGMAEALEAMTSNEPELTAVIERFLAALAAADVSDGPRVDVMIAAEALANPAVHRVVVANRESIRAALTRVIEKHQRARDDWSGHSAEALAELLYATYQGLLVSVALGEQPDIARVLLALKAMRFA